MHIHAIFKADRPVKPKTITLFGQATAEFDVAGVISFGKVKNFRCAVDVEKPEYISAHIETEEDKAFVSALLCEKMFSAIHQFFDVCVDGKRVTISYIDRMEIEFGHYLLRVPTKSLMLPNSLEAFVDIILDFKYDILDAEMDQLQYDVKALRIGDDPKTAVILPIFDGSFDMKRWMGWTYTASTYDTKTHTIQPKVYQMVMKALDQLEQMEGKHKFFCVEDIRRPWHNETLRERCDVSKMVIHYTRNGLPKEIVLEGVWG